MVELAKNSWSGLEYKSGKETKVPSVHILVAGFECDSVSSLSKDRKNTKYCMELGVEKTGRTGRATLRYLEDFRPRLAWFENVKGLSGDNIRFVVSECNRFGYYVVHEEVEVEHFGSACRRLRLWFCVV